MTSTSRRTRKGNLELFDPTNTDRSTTIEPGAAGIWFHAVDRGTDQRVSIYLDTKLLNEHAAEVFRLRTEMDI